MHTCTRFLVLLSFTLLATSCQKDKDEQPAPAAPEPTYRMSSAVFYPSSGTAVGTSHRANRVLGAASRENGQVVLRFKSRQDAPEDEVRLVLPSSFLTSKAGTYAYQTTAAPTPNTVQVTYTKTYQLSISSLLSKVYKGHEQTTEGNFVITAFDEKNQLISGSYEATFKDVSDPFSEISPPPARKSHVAVYGEFSHVSIR